MKVLLADAGVMTIELSEAFDIVNQSCAVCAATGRPAAHKKTSLTHINKSFNQSTQADFVIIYLKGKKFEVLNIIEAATRYGERTIEFYRTAKQVTEIFERTWFCEHGAPMTFSADPELCLTVLNYFLDKYGIIKRERPSSSSHNNGRIERNNGVFKSIVEGLEKSWSSRERSNQIGKIIISNQHVQGLKDT